MTSAGEDAEPEPEASASGTTTLSREMIEDGQKGKNRGGRKEKKTETRPTK